MKKKVTVEFTGALDWFRATVLHLLGFRTLPTLLGGRFMHTVKADHPNIPFKFQDVKAFDSEGDPIPNADLTLRVVSDNPSAVEVQFPIGDDPNSGELVVVGPNRDTGEPNIANVNFLIYQKDALLGSLLDDQFTVIVGDATKVSGSVALGEIQEA